MMDLLGWQKESTKMGFHYEPMLQDSAPLVCKRMAGAKNCDVTIALVISAAFPPVALFSTQGRADLGPGFRSMLTMVAQIPGANVRAVFFREFDAEMRHRHFRKLLRRVLAA
jgi:hypothetical protein